MEKNNLNQEVIKSSIQLVPIELIDILNPRERNEKVFANIVESIRLVGLKKPITVTPKGDQYSQRFNLICGEGRLRAFRMLGESSIPARIIDVDIEEALIMSLAENIARRQYQPLELLSCIERLSDLGYDKLAISQKTGLVPEYIQGIVALLKNGEERLLAAVEKGRIPLNVALKIGRSGNSDQDIQNALQDAYESGAIKGNQLSHARRVIERRKSSGKSLKKSAPAEPVKVTAMSLVRTYQNEVERQKLVVRKGDLTQQRLAFIVGALNELGKDDNFLTLLRAELLEELPQYLAERVWKK